MTPREYVEIVRERWRYIIAGLLLGLVAAIAAIALVPREYAASVTVMVASQLPSNPANSGAASKGTDISGQRLGIYEELLRSTRLTRDVISTLHLNVTPEELADHIAVTTTPNSVLLTATVSDRSADQAILIANTVAAQFIRNVAEIENPSDPTLPAALVGKVFEPAQPPADLITPRPVLYIVVGLEIGLVLGLGAALLRHALDSRIRRRGQLEEILRAPVLGIVGRDSNIPSQPLVYGRNAELAEAFRQLRTNIQFMIINRGRKVILATSATSGQGRSVTICNLGFTLAETGLRVLILDADLRRPSIAKSLRIDASIGLTDVLVHRNSIDEAIRPVGPTLDVLPAGMIPPNPSELLGSDRMTSLLATLRERYDAVLIDTAPVLPVTDAAVLAQRVDGVILVVRHGHARVPEIRATNDALQAVSGRILGSVLTMVPRARIRRRTEDGTLPPLTRDAAPGSVLESAMGNAVSATVPTHLPSADGAVPPGPNGRW
jgi:tyrosine-protein kinase